MSSAPAYSFRCQVCAKQFTYDQPGEPLCTGPSETRDEHEPTVMLLIRTRDRAALDRYVPPEVGEARATGPLWVPE